MILTFEQEVVEDVALAVGLPAAALKEFCQLALQSIDSGSPATSVFAKAAQALGVEPQLVLRAVQGLSQVFIECAKRAVSKKDFELSVADIKFADEPRATLSQVRKRQTLRHSV
jgi:COMMD2-7/10, HN domain